MPMITRQMSIKLSEYLYQRSGLDFLHYDSLIQLVELKCACEELFPQFFPRENRDYPGLPVFFAPPRATPLAETRAQYEQRLQEDFSTVLANVLSHSKFQRGHVATPG